MRWKERGEPHPMLALLLEILVQAVANIGVLAIPAMIQAYDPTPSFSWLDGLGYAIWLFAWIFESVADMQKQNFLHMCYTRRLKMQVCNVGLWKYSRHPNYFGEWMVLLTFLSFSSFLWHHL